MKCEVLAPAGTREALSAAVRCGADAVYLGSGKFNARRGAANFSTLEELKEAVGYCHAGGVKVYLTLNTLVSDHEMSDALDELRCACQAGVDAVIVQDIGLAKLISKCAPDLHMHASTQMSVHSVSALDFLKRMGFKRVVLARELDSKQMELICRHASDIGIEIEVFVHGALCMCLSGQCYMSGVIGQRSGNRGMCAQPCRMQYSDGSYPLSLKDMSLIDEVDRLAKMGVASLKIEGRMKRPEYVAAAVTAFRRAADGQEVDSDIRGLLGSVFSRSGHTDGYFKGSLGKAMFGRRTEEAKDESGATFGKLHQLYRSERQSQPVDITLKLDNNGAVMTVSDGQYTVTSKSEAEPAQKLPLDFDRASTLCAKLGGTPFYLNRLEFSNDYGMTLPASAVNAMRRECCEGLIAKRVGRTVQFTPVNINNPSRREGKSAIFVRLDNISQLPKNIALADRVYLPLGSKLPDHKSVGVELPRAMFDGEDKVVSQLKDAVNMGAKYALCHNIASVELAQRAGLKIHLGFGMNIFNSTALSVIEHESATLSFELTLKQALAIGSGGIIAYGRLPLMLTRNCPSGGKNNCAACSQSLTDRKGVTFPVKCRGGYSEIFNSKPLMLSKERDDLSPFDFLTLYFTDEDASRCTEILDCYREGAAVSGDFTRGLYYRGVE